MEHVFLKTTDEERERHRRMREAADKEMPEIIKWDKVQRQLWALADDAGRMIEQIEHGQMPPSEEVEALREKVKAALDSRREVATR